MSAVCKHPEYGSFVVSIAVTEGSYPVLMFLTKEAGWMPVQEDIDEILHSALEDDSWAQNGGTPRKDIKMPSESEGWAVDTVYYGKNGRELKEFLINDEEKKYYASAALAEERLRREGNYVCYYCIPARLPIGEYYVFKSITRILKKYTL